MYKISYFTEQDHKEIQAFMMEHPFAVICSNGDGYPSATQVPLDIQFIGDDIILTGHIMKNTDHHKSFLENKNVLVLFNGPHAFINAAWYTNPKVASTWNYMTVHAKGNISFTNEEDTLRVIESLTDKYAGKESESAFRNLDEAYINKLVKAIIAFRIEVKSIDAVFKLSQNHDIETRQNIIKKLIEERNDNAANIAREMNKRINVPKLSK